MTLQALVFGMAGAVAATAATGAMPVTFHKDVEPILQARCQECHRAGEIAPMSFMSYDLTRPWAKAIKGAVLARKMPPWLADAHYGKFSNDRSMSQSEINTLAAWADSGAREGEAKDAPKPREFVMGWAIGKPDQVFEMPKAVEIPATGIVDYTYMVIPSGFTEDKWIQMAEARAGAREAMHHVIIFIRPPGGTFLKNAPIGEPYIPRSRGEGGLPGELLVGFAPGLPPTECKEGEAKLVPAGSDFVLQLHYTPNGHATSDKTKLGVIFAKEPPKYRVMTVNAINAYFKIPAGDGNYEVTSKNTLKEDVKLVSMMPHMHLRGKDFEYRAVYPTGETQTLLRVPKYDFNWQLSYVLDRELLLPKNTRIECTAHYDNSVNNPANPDATKEVRWGDQTFEEMMIGWFDVAVDATKDPSNVRRIATFERN